jgi:hypothetical protein
MVSMSVAPYLAATAPLLLYLAKGMRAQRTARLISDAVVAHALRRVRLTRVPRLPPPSDFPHPASYRYAPGAC